MDYSETDATCGLCDVGFNSCNIFGIGHSIAFAKAQIVGCHSSSRLNFVHFHLLDNYFSMFLFATGFENYGKCRFFTNVGGCMVLASINFRSYINILDNSSNHSTLARQPGLG